MQIIEVKNNLVRISYEPSQEELILSSFLTLKDESEAQSSSFVGQVMHLEGTTKGHFAIVKLLFNFNSEGVITNYNGAIPHLKSVISYVETQNLLGLLPVETPVVIGEIAQQKVVLRLDDSIFRDKLVVFSEREADKKLLIENINAQLAHGGKKVLVIDLLGDFDFSSNKLVAAEDFKLPLNYETINFIYEKGLDDANAETKALIQEIFLEVQEYVKTLDGGFIPFESFKNVVDSQYKELGLVELVLLKNKLLKYYEEGVFAQEKAQFESLETSLAQKETTILDLSQVDEKIQREVLSYVYSLIGQSEDEIYVLVNVDNSNSDKKLLKQVYTSKSAHSTVICSYSYKYSNELKQVAKDLILFAPITQQKDFASYNTFLNKLNPDEFIIYGNSTHNLPLIVKLDDTPQQMLPEVITSNESTDAIDNEDDMNLPASPTEIDFTEVNDEDLLDVQIRQDVDQIYTAPRGDSSQDAFSEDVFVENPTESVQEQGQFSEAEIDAEYLTENDLDFIDDLNMEQDEGFVQGGQSSYGDDVSEPLVIEEVAPSVAAELSNNFGDDFDESFFEEASHNLANDDSDQPIAQPYALQEDSSSGLSFAQQLQQPQAQAQEGSLDDLQFESTSAIIREDSPSMDILPVSDAFIPNLPVYTSEAVESATADQLEQGDVVTHAKYGKGTVEKMISYGTKTLCSIHFDNVGRRLLDPSLAELKKI